MSKPSKPRYRIKCLKDGKIFETMDELCEYYHRTKDSVQYRLDVIKDYKDGYNFVRIFDNEEALKSVEAIDSSKFVEKYGDKTVPIPGYEGHYTISTRGVITNVQNHDRIIPIKTTVTVKHKAVLHKGGSTMQTHDVINLMKSAFGDPEKAE